MPAYRFANSIGIVRNFALILLCGLLFAGDARDTAEIQIRRLLREFVTAQSSTGSRLAGMPYADRTAVESGNRVPLDPLPLAIKGRSVSQRRLLGLINIFDGQWREAEHILGKLALELPGDAAIQNDLGVVQMALEPSDASA